MGSDPPLRGVCVFGGGVGLAVPPPQPLCGCWGAGPPLTRVWDPHRVAGGCPSLSLGQPCLGATLLISSLLLYPCVSIQGQGSGTGLTLWGLLCPQCENWGALGPNSIANVGSGLPGHPLWF